MSDLEPIAFPGALARKQSAPAQKITTFDKRELMRILDLYGRMVAAGEWRDYAISFLKDRAVFSVFRRSSEQPLYRIEKSPALARKQGEYAVVNSTGFVLKRGHDLGRVLLAIDKRLSVRQLAAIVFSVRRIDPPLHALPKTIVIEAMEFGNARDGHRQGNQGQRAR